MDSAALYVHIPFCTAKCDYCDFFSKGGATSVPEEYVRALVNEARFYAKKYAINGWSTLYIGGGTPSLLSAVYIESFLRTVQEIGAYHQPVKEITVEVNPETLTAEYLEALTRAGVTRLSIGVQSLNSVELQNVHRRCTVEQIRNGMKLVHSLWNGHTNVDVIAGLPGQSIKTLKQTITEVLSWRPDHISLYTLTVEEGTPLEKKINAGALGTWNIDFADRMWLFGRDFLRHGGFLQYEVSNFCKADCESIHNMAYWQQENYIGIGSGATGTLYDFSQENACCGLRWENSHNIEYYTKFWQSIPQEYEREAKIPRSIEKLDLKTEEFEFLMLGFRTLKGVSAEEYKKRFFTLAPFYGNIEKRLRIGMQNSIWDDFCKKKWAVTIQKSSNICYALTEDGLLYANVLLVALD